MSHFGAWFIGSALAVLLAFGLAYLMHLVHRWISRRMVPAPRVTDPPSREIHLNDHYTLIKR